MTTTTPSMQTSSTMPLHDLADLALAAEGVRRIEWAEREMPVLRLIRLRVKRAQSVLPSPQFRPNRIMARSFGLAFLSSR